MSRLEEDFARGKAERTRENTDWLSRKSLQTKRIPRHQFTITFYLLLTVQAFALQSSFTVFNANSRLRTRPTRYISASPTTVNSIFAAFHLFIGASPQQGAPISIFQINLNKNKIHFNFINFTIIKFVILQLMEQPDCVDECPHFVKNQLEGYGYGTEQIFRPGKLFGLKIYGKSTHSDFGKTICQRDALSRFFLFHLNFISNYILKNKK